MAWLRIGHRGAAGSAPEHTEAAFRRALDLGVDMIELDVQLSRDEELVVMHDLDLQRTTTRSGKVREHDFVDIKRLDAGSWFGPGFAGEPPLCLSEVIEIVAGRARLNVEIKAPEADWPVMAARLIQTLRTYELTQSTIVSCFDPGALAALRARADDVQLGLLWQRPEVNEAWKWTAQLRALSFHPHWMLVSPDLLDAARVRGLAVLVWTVNEVDAMRGLVRQGVGGIISDFPERFAAVDVGSP